MQEHEDAMALLDRCALGPGTPACIARTRWRAGTIACARACPRRNIHWEAPIISLEGREAMRCCVYIAKSIAFLQLQPSVVAVRAQAQACSACMHVP